ncbi:MAG: hypothetical protein A3F33_03070 [Candidatus Woykebacteria bacterium RIFCSPHIGHO2_12_FULL_43_10]|uniref:Uncharacterized protein n=2 Tax=Candidatus Woykeibacteriota TaxID=1817899 RepID=A0A1G1WXI9_9BACT|nr:MAG: hypothetical protein A2802_01690 [Candidatus Woykebacteria bacterium RIFCSPHIGHO2_01_FULL_43_29]OGY28726.1 MAG: hypothetical protein A3J50_01270 [Candidatus Woykebacteria bacterium RIFCSPHIGHO2_02_FULL_43_16b]OGY29801.1 MAG: hypothetical protein A3F33_03070 [Candidatus Woykebacteria bacterium RIFCSPHIGHO2_12_FULL_43_10]OGY32476.1 MAG: hypothetical protein A3A61_00795 [Candidatus Woykebacteria bacterium RIFCSPLOWO2_01_FULL_43_14]
MREKGGKMDQQQNQTRQRLHTSRLRLARLIRRITLRRAKELIALNFARRYEKILAQAMKDLDTAGTLNIPDVERLMREVVETLTGVFSAEGEGMEILIPSDASALGDNLGVVPTPRQKKPPRKGKKLVLKTTDHGANIVAFNFGEKPPAETFESALRRTFGEGWESKTIAVMGHGPGRIEQRTFAQDVALGSGSVLRRYVSTTISNLLIMKKGLPPGAIVGSQLQRLFAQLNETLRWDDIPPTINKWGIKLEDQGEEAAQS